LTAEWRVVLAGLRPGDRPGPELRRRLKRYAARQLSRRQRRHLGPSAPNSDRAESRCEL